MKHPLLNPESKNHYDSKKASIYEYEKIETVSGMIAVCTFEIFKYKARLGKKSLIKGMIEGIIKKHLNGLNPKMAYDFIDSHKKEIEQSDLVKIDTWDEYRTLLEALHAKGHGEETVYSALYIEGIELEYSL